MKLFHEAAIEQFIKYQQYTNQECQIGIKNSFREVAWAGLDSWTREIIEHRFMRKPSDTIDHILEELDLYAARKMAGPK